MVDSLTECVALERACVEAVAQLVGTTTMSEAGLRELRAVCERAMDAVVPDHRHRFSLYLGQHPNEPTALCLAVHLSHKPEATDGPQAGNRGEDRQGVGVDPPHLPE